MDKIEVVINVSRRQDPDALPIQGNTFLRSAVALIADAAQVAGESAIHHQFELGGEIFSLRQAAGVGHLQILGSSGIVSRLRSLQKSENGSAGSIASKWVLGRLVCRRRGGGAQ